MKKLLFLLILTTVIGTNGFSQDKNSDIMRLLEVMNTEQMSESMFSSMIPALKQQVTSLVKDDTSKEKVDEAMGKLMEEVAEEMKAMTSKLNSTEMVNIYDKHFSQEEIKNLIDFYESPTGKKLLEKTPEISNELMNAMMTQYMPEFQASLQKKFEEFSKSISEK